MKQLTKASILLMVLISSVLLQQKHAHAQCNPNDEIESWYDWAKGWQNYAADLYPISEKQEMSVGDSLHLMIANEGKLLKKHPKQTYLNNLLDKICQHVERPEIAYKIFVLDDDQSLNAFSLAGGRIYITAKMLSWVETEDELAFIVAHEIAHVDKKHGIRKVQTAEAAKHAAHHAGVQEYGDLVAGATLLLSSPFGQIDEYEADRWGAVLALKSGYNPRKGLRFFEKMSEKENYDFYEKILRTHPYSAERLACMEDFLSNELDLPSK